MHDMRNGICPLCEHDEIIESIPADFGANNYEKQAAVTYDPRWLFDSRDQAAPRGLLKTYVCRECGFVQWFAQEPETIPIDGPHQTRLIKGKKPKAPFR